jgi:hypothetical protein
MIWLLDMRHERPLVVRFRPALNSFTLTNDVNGEGTFVVHRAGSQTPSPQRTNATSYMYLQLLLPPLSSSSNPLNCFGYSSLLPQFSRKMFYVAKMQFRDITVPLLQPPSY